LKVANEFWDFLGGDGCYNELLNCFERVGIELRPEIDESINMVIASNLMTKKQSHLDNEKNIKTNIPKIILSRSIN
jgi:hypothetical protein